MSATGDAMINQMNDESGVKYPHIRVRLSGQDGNAYAIVTRVAAALRQNNVPNVEIERYKREAFAGDYDHVIQTTINTVDVR